MSPSSTITSPNIGHTHRRVLSESKSTTPLRAACDACHAAKVRCSGDSACTRCRRDARPCRYSARGPMGKPKGSLNKKTIARMRAAGTAVPRIQKRGSSSSEDSDKSLYSPIYRHAADFIDPWPASGHSDSSNVTTPGTCFPSMESLVRDFVLDRVDPSLMGNRAASPANRAVERHDSDEDHDLCTCARSVTSQISTLRSVSWRPSTASLDDLLRCCQQTTGLVHGFTQCDDCQDDIDLHILGSVLLSTLFKKLIKPAISIRKRFSPPEDTRRMSVSVSIQLGEAMEKVAIDSLTRMMLQTLDKLGRNAHNAVADDKLQTQFLWSEVDRLQRDVRSLSL